jgi:hypothetical protein
MLSIHKVGKTLRDLGIESEVMRPNKVFVYKPCIEHQFLQWYFMGHGCSMLGSYKARRKGLGRFRPHLRMTAGLALSNPTNGV